MRSYNLKVYVDEPKESLLLKDGETEISTSTFTAGAKFVLFLVAAEHEGKILKVFDGESYITDALFVINMEVEEVGAVKGSTPPASNKHTAILNNNELIQVTTPDRDYVYSAQINEFDETIYDTSGGGNIQKAYMDGFLKGFFIGQNA